MTATIRATVTGICISACLAVDGHAQFNFRDDFSDLNHTDGDPVTWGPGGFPDGTRDASSGDLVLTPFGTAGMTAAVDEVYNDHSIRTQIRMEDLDFARVGIYARSTPTATYTASIDPAGEVLLEIFTADFGFVESASTDLEVTEQDILLQMDLFGELLSVTAWAEGEPQPEPQIVIDDDLIAEGTLGVFLNSNGGQASATFRYFEVNSAVISDQTVGDFNGDATVDVEDADLLVAAVATGAGELRFDLTGDGAVDQQDIHFMIKDVSNSWLGDANLDGEFNSGDLVAVFQAGEYEDEVEDNSGWSSGDWDGDGDFTSGDLVVAFQDGGYELGRRVAANAVPEPASFFMPMAGLIGIAIRRRYVVA